MVSKVSDGSESSGFLTTVLRGSGEEGTGKFTSQGTVGPETTSGIQEGLDLSRHGTETGGDTKQETVSFLQVINGDDGNIRLGRGVQSGQEFFRESLRNYKKKNVNALLYLFVYKLYLGRSWHQHQRQQDPFGLPKRECRCGGRESR